MLVSLVAVFFFCTFFFAQLLFLHIDDFILGLLIKLESLLIAPSLYTIDAFSFLHIRSRFATLFSFLLEANAMNRSNHRFRCYLIANWIISYSPLLLSFAQIYFQTPFPISRSPSSLILWSFSLSLSRSFASSLISNDKWKIFFNSELWSWWSFRVGLGRGALFHFCFVVSIKRFF